MQATITVAVASCGRPQSLARCLAGIQAQRLAPAEVIVVDQAPSEEARAVVHDSGLNVRYQEQHRLGLSASRNLALALASSSVLAVTDDDCVPDPGWLEAISAAFRRRPRPAAVTGRILPLGERPPGGFAVSLRDSPQPVDHRGRQVPWGVGSGGNFAASVEVLRAVGGWDERLGAGTRGRAAEDAELIYRLLLSGELVRYDPAAIVHHAWQSRERRMATRWSYGFGVGALGGLRLAARDLFAMRLIWAYARHHLRLLARACRARVPTDVNGHIRALISVVPGLVYGLREGLRAGVEKEIQ